MRTLILAMVVAFGTTVAIPVMAQQQTAPQQQLKDQADKGVKTRNSGESGYVADEEKPGASAHPPGQPDKSGNQTTTGERSGNTGGRGSEAGGNSR
jgi:hypothetical protein